jgi:hypothetical protein
MTMDEASIPRLEAISRDYSETPRRVLFVLGSGDGTAADIFGQLLHLPHSTVDPDQLAEMVAGSRRSLIVSTPMQMVPELVRSLSRANVAIYQVQLLEEAADSPVDP